LKDANSINNKGKRLLNNSENYKNKSTFKKLRPIYFTRNLSNYLNNNKENTSKAICSNKVTTNTR
ncbi:4026_t:CDS:1, partial [Dentiscutata heterogama]